MAPKVIRRRRNVPAGAREQGSRVPIARAPCHAGRRRITGTACTACTAFSPNHHLSISDRRRGVSDASCDIVRRKCRTPHLALGAGGALIRSCRGVVARQVVRPPPPIPAPIFVARCRRPDRLASCPARAMKRVAYRRSREVLLANRGCRFMPSERDERLVM